MTKGILIIGDRDNKLSKNILSFYESKNRYIEHITPENIKSLNPHSKSCNVYVTKDITFNKTEQELIRGFFADSEYNRVLMTSVSMPSINTKAIKGLYDIFFIPHKSLKSGLMMLRLKFVIDCHYPELESYVKFIADINTNMFLHIKFLDGKMMLSSIDINDFKYTDESADVVTVFDEGEDDNKDVEDDIVKIIL